MLPKWCNTHLDFAAAKYQLVLVSWCFQRQRPCLDSRQLQGFCREKGKRSCFEEKGILPTNIIITLKNNLFACLKKVDQELTIKRNSDQLAVSVESECKRPSASRLSGLTGRWAIPRKPRYGTSRLLEKNEQANDISK